MSDHKVSTPAELISPEAQAFMSQMIKDAVSAVFEQMAPILKDVAVMPAKLAEAEAIRRAPDPAKVARESREKQLMQQEEQENRANNERRQQACSHRYPNSAWAVNVVRNMPDRQCRFICALCNAWFAPKEWRIGAPDAENPRGRPYIAPEHPMYRQVAEILSTKG